MRGSISSRAVLFLLAVLATVGMIAGPAGAATITVDSFTSWKNDGGDPVGTFDASGADKLVVVVTGEHGFPNNAGGDCLGITYDGVALTQAVDRDPVVITEDPYLVDQIYNDIWYLDHPSTSTGEIIADVQTRGVVTVFALSGTADGYGATAISASSTRSVDLGTTGLNSIVIASFGMGGFGNTADVQNVTADAPLIQTSAIKNSNRSWDGHVTGYATVAEPGTATYSFSGGNVSGAHVIAAEFLAKVPTLYWDINGTDANSGAASGDASGIWDSTTNWNTDSTGGAGGTVSGWQAGNTAFFSAGDDATGPSTVTVNGTQDITGLTFAEGTVTVADGGTGALQMSADSVMSVAPGLSATVETPVSGSGWKLYKTGEGTLTISGDLSHTGATEVVGGKLILAGNNVAATGGLTIGTGTVVQFNSLASINGTDRVLVNAGSTVAFGSGVSATDILTAMSDRIDSSSTGVIAADNQENTAFDFNTSGLTAASFGAIGDVTYGGTLTPNNDVYRLGGGGGTLTIANDNALTGTGRSVEIYGNVIVSGANSYDGATTVYAGILRAGNAEAFGPASTASLAFSAGSTGKVQLYGTNMTVAGLSGSGTIENGADADAALTVSSSSAVTCDSVLQDGSGTGKLGLTKDGSGTLVLTAANTFTGDTIVSAGTLQIGSNNSSGTLGAASYAGNISIADGAKLLFNNDTSQTLSGVISGAGDLQKAGSGTLTLSGDNTYTGKTTIAGAGAGGPTVSVSSFNSVNGGIPAMASSSLARRPPWKTAPLTWALAATSGTAP